MMQPVILGFLILIILWIIWKIVGSPTLSVSTDKGNYLKGETVIIGGMLQDSLGNPLNGKTVNLVISPPVGDSYTLPASTTQPDGSYSSTWLIPADAEEGTFTLSASALSEVANTTFTHLQRMIEG